MDSAHPRSIWLQVLALGVLFLGGGAAGVRLAGALVPQSAAAQFVGLFTFPVAFMSGLHAWLGVAVALALWRMVTRRGAASGRHWSDVPPGSAVFVPVSVVLAGIAGMLIGALGSSVGFIATVATYLVCGLLYGVACWRLAANGYLPFPRE